MEAPSCVARPLEVLVVRKALWARQLWVVLLGCLLLASGLPVAALGEENAVEAEEETPEVVLESSNGRADGVITQAYDTNAQLTYVPASPITFVENSGEKDYDDAGKVCYLYQYNPSEGDVLKVVSNGTTHTYRRTASYSWKDEQGWYADIDVQLYARLSATQNKKGSHTLTVRYQNFDAEGLGSVSFSIVSSPVASIAYSPAHAIVLVRGVDSSSYYEYDPTTGQGHTYHHYFFPKDSRLLGDVLVVNYVDGTSKRYVYAKFADPDAGYERMGFVNERDKTDFIEEYDIDITAEQPYAKRWQAGSHAFTVRYEGQTASVPVTVQKQTVTKVAYARKQAYKTSTAKAIAYTKKLGIYDKSYAKRVHKYQLHFPAIEPADGDVLKVTESGETVRYVYSAARSEFVCKSGSGTAIPKRDVVIRELVAEPTTKKAAFPCTYRGVDFSIPFTVVRKAQSVTVKKAQVVIGKRQLLNVKCSGFAQTPLSCKSSRPIVATVDSHGMIVARHLGTTRITVTAKGNVAYKKSKAKVVLVRVGKANPMKATAKKGIKLKVGEAASVLTVRKAKGAVQYANVSTKKAAKRFKVNAKTGEVTARKGTKRGTYKIKIKVRAKGTKTYLPRTRTVTVKVTV